MVVPQSSIMPYLSLLLLAVDPVSEYLSMSKCSRQAGVELVAKAESMALSRVTGRTIAWPMKMEAQSLE